DRAGRARRDVDGQDRAGRARRDVDGQDRAAVQPSHDGRLAPQPVKRARLNDVAKLAGVSTSPASRVLNGVGELSEDTRIAVMQAAAELDYRPSPVARSLRT